MEPNRNNHIRAAITIRKKLTLAISITALLAVTSSAAIVREPYLQKGTPTSVTVVWRTDSSSPSDSRVQYGTDANNLNQTATSTAVIPPSNSSVRDHIVTVTGLSSDMKYFYNVGTTSGGVQGGGTTEYYFTTSPVTGSTQPFTAWIIGDSGSGGPTQQAVRDAMLAETGPNRPDIFLHFGDIAYTSGTDSQFTNNHFAVYQDILRHTVFWPCIGNHEASVGSSDSPTQTGPYYEAFVLPAAAEAGGVVSGTEAYYSFDYANVHFIVLDSDDTSRSIGSPMLTWLTNDLAATNQNWVIAYFHHPAYSKGTHDSDLASDSGGRLRDMRENVLPILEAGGVDVVMTGHSHIYERSYLIDGVYGYGSSPNYATPDFATLLADGHILDDGDGRPSGDGAYLKSPGINAYDGAVYIVAGHGALSTGGSADHPVMFFSEKANGSGLLTIDANTLTLKNVRADGVISDTFTIVKTLICTPPLLSDFNNDCRVDFKDFAILCQSWLKCNLNPSDACP